MTLMPNHRNVYISLATSMSKTGKFQLTPLVHKILKNLIVKKGLNEFHLKIVKRSSDLSNLQIRLSPFAWRCSRDLS